MNECTPRKYCSIKYRDLDYAVQAILKLRDQGYKNRERGDCGQHGYDQYAPVVVYCSKSDVQSAFRLVPLSSTSWAWLIMAARDPTSGRLQYFVDKCLPFGVSVSCAIFQHVSDAIHHIAQYKTGSDITSYLDDFLFLTLTLWRCNQLLKQFLAICEEVGFPHLFR